MADDWQVGDLALCVDDGPSAFGESNLVRGRCYTVAALSPCYDGIPGLHLVEVISKSPVGFDPPRFRKIRPHSPDAEDAETIRLLTGAPVREPVA